MEINTMRQIKNYLTGQRVRILSKEVLLQIGYEDNDDKNDFLNLLAGKEVTIQDSYENGQIYTCKEYPDIAIYKVFIASLVIEDTLAFKSIGKMIGLTTEPTRRTFNIAVNKIRNLVGNNEDEKYDLEGLWSEQK
jgi:hypothetical protein